MPKEVQVNVNQEDIKELIWELNKQIIVKQKTINLILKENQKLIEENKKLQLQIDEYLKQMAGSKKE